MRDIVVPEVIGIVLTLVLQCVLPRCFAQVGTLSCVPYCRIEPLVSIISNNTIYRENTAIEVRAWKIESLLATHFFQIREKNSQTQI